jgi:phage shock protein E
LLVTATVLVILGLVFLQSPRSLSAIDAFKLLQSDSSVVLLDVRTEDEWHGPEGRIAGATLIPLQELEQRIGELESHRQQAILVYCRSGRRSRNAAALLEKYGFRGLNLEGGILQWKKLELPVVLENPK